MKKILSLTALVALSGTLFAQATLLESTKKYLNTHEAVLSTANETPKSFIQATKKFTQGGSIAGAGDTIFTETFGSGSLPLGWTNTTVSGPGGWTWTNQMSQGQYAGGTAAIQSTTGTNGFMILDADNHNSPTPGGGFVDVDAVLAMPTQNLTNYPSVVLQFEHYFRPFSNSTLEVEVIVGTDTAVYDVRHNVATNTQSGAGGAPFVEQIKISDIAGGESNVQIRFHWSDESHYFWQVDDVLLLEGDENDLGFANIYTGGSQDSVSWTYYTMVPARQANHQSLTFGADIQNHGSNLQTGAQLHANVDGPSGFSWSGQSVKGNINAASSAKSDVTTDFDPNGGVGNYDVEVFVTSDSSLTSTDDDTLTMSLEVTDSIFALDHGTGPLLNEGFYYPTSPEYEMGNVFEIKERDTVTGVWWYVASNNNASPSVFASHVSFNVYELDTVAGNWNLMYQSVNPNPPDAANPERFVLNSGDAGNWVFYPFNEDTLGIGDYLVTVDVFSTYGVDTIFFSYSGEYDQFTQSRVILNNTIFGSSFIPTLRLATTKFSCPVLQSNSIEVVQASCGASDGSATLELLNGKAPFSFAWDAAAGSQTDSIATNLAAGTYQVTVTDANNCSFIAQVNLSNLGAPSILSSNVDDELCFNDANGAIRLSVSGGTAPLTYTWKDGLGSTIASGVDLDSLVGVAGGSYTVEILDASPTPCIQSRQFNVAGPSAPLQLISSIYGPNATGEVLNCFGDNDGSVLLGFFGGTPNYSYVWSDNGTINSNERTGLSEGTYFVTVTDGNGCTKTETVPITAPQALTILTSSQINYDPVGCTASIAASVVGGTGTIAQKTYLWTKPDATTETTTNSTLSNITLVGNYTLDVTDLRNCMTSHTFNVDNSAPGACVSVEEVYSEEGITVYPNPTNGFVTVDVDGQANVSVRNVIGQEVYNGTAQDQVTIDLTDEVKGVYLITVTSNEVERTSRVILK